VLTLVQEVPSALAFVVLPALDGPVELRAHQNFRHPTCSVAGSVASRAWARRALPPQLRHFDETSPGSGPDREPEGGWPEFGWKCCLLLDASAVVEVVRQLDGLGQHRPSELSVAAVPGCSRRYHDRLKLVGQALL
jgi:hypothetical protein